MAPPQYIEVARRYIALLKVQAKVQKTEKHLFGFAKRFHALCRNELGGDVGRVEDVLTFVEKEYNNEKYNIPVTTSPEHFVHTIPWVESEHKKAILKAKRLKESNKTGSVY